MIIILTGHRGIGKTTFLLKSIAQLKTQGEKISGILTPPVFNDNNEKIGFDAYDVKSGERWKLGRTDKSLAGPSFGPYTFSENGFIRANEKIQENLNQNMTSIFLDEVGPLELSRHRGFFPLLSQFKALNQQQNLYIVIRRELIDQFISNYIPGDNYKIITITEENRDTLQLVP
jgi:nucleoside-triphosphatase THEP1